MPFFDLFSYQVAVFRKVNIEIVFPYIIGKAEPGYFLTWQKSVGKNVHIQESYQEDENANFSQLKHAQSFYSPVKHHSVNQEVCGGANQCAGPAEYGGIGERNQEFLGGKAHFISPLLEKRTENYNHGGIV